MVRNAFFLFLLIPAAFCACAAAEPAPDLAERVIIVVNSRDPDSLRIGRHYAERRKIPAANILAVDAPTGETISRKEFVEDIFNPLRRQLLAEGWFRGTGSRLKDGDGRHRSLIEGHRISYLVLCRGIPLRIENDPDKITPAMERTVRKAFRINAASVDSELALLTGLAPAISFVPNPLFQKKTPADTELGSVLKVARLDGPSPAAAMALVDHAMEAEATGLRGRAYVDADGPHATGITWLRSTARHIESLGFDMHLREEPGIFPMASRFDAPALYFGWYEADIDGPFLLDRFKFPAGAIAFHVHSFSARTLRSQTSGWCGPVVARGASVTLGNVFEPYLEVSHRPDLFLEWVSEGGNVGDAAAYSIRGYSWQGVLIGDPLYRPFARSLEEQLEQVEKEEAGLLGSYAVIRRMNLLAEEGKEAEAIEAGRRGLDRQPSLALALAVAKLQVEAGERPQAVRTLRLAEFLQQVPAMEVMVAKEVADLLSSLGEHRRGLSVYEVLLDDPRLPAELKKPLLESGLPLAERLGRDSLGREWRLQLQALQQP